MATSDTNPMYYRFEGLLLAIEFFTQRFDTEQLAAFSFEFANEILTLNASALFVREGSRFVLKQKRLYNHIDHYFFEDNEKLKQLVTFRGHTMTEHLEYVFEPHDIERLEIRWLMPLMISDKLHGFIISNGNTTGHFTEDDMVMANTLMRLINNSLENSRHFAELQKSNAKLDQKNFNLFAINQSTKVLLSEMSLSRLHETATDVFSEVTSSQITSFGIVDPITKRLTITGFRNVIAYTQYYGDFELRTTKYHGPVVLHIERDRERLQTIFADYKQLHTLEAEYIILIVQQHIIGMVTLSRPVNDERKYDESTFELVESLANSAFIAISNAMLFEEANRQRQSAESKLRLLQSLNRLVKNINECTTVEELCYFTVKTMQLTFHVDKMLICLREGDHYVVKEAGGFESDSEVKGQVLLSVDELKEEWLEERVIVDHAADAALRQLPPETADWLGPSDCFVLAPLTVSNRLVLADDPFPLGFVLVLGMQSSVVEEDMLLIDTIAKNISPVLHQMSVTQTMREQYIQDERAAFLAAVKQKRKDWEAYEVDYFVYYQPYRPHPFAAAPSSEEAVAALSETLGTEEADLELFQFGGFRFLISYVPIGDEAWTALPPRIDADTLIQSSF